MLVSKTPLSVDEWRRFGGSVQGVGTWLAGWLVVLWRSE